LIGDGLPDTGSQYRWSPLFRATQPMAALAVCIVGFVASIATCLGIGARFAPFVAWLSLMTIHQRAPWLSMPGELLIAAGLFYLIIDTGRTVWSAVPARDDGVSRVTANLALRSVQVHFLLWLMFSMASMLQYNAWWNGTAVSLMSEQIQGLSGPIPRTSPWGQMLTHGMMFLQGVALLTLPRPTTVGIGVIAAILFALCVAIFAGDWMYALAILAMVVSFVPYHVSTVHGSASS
jgi:hypothetical protein